MWAHGVRVVAIDNPTDGYFYCFVGKCLASHSKIKIVKNNTSNAAYHLREAHNIVSSSSAEKMKRKQDLVESNSKAARILGEMAPLRFWGLKIAQFCICTLQPFAVVEDTSFRFFLSHITGAPATLSTKMLKRHIVEMYIATKQHTVQQLAAVKQAALGRACFHLNVDLWTSKINGNKYMGVRLYFVDTNFNYCSKVLAVQPFNPSTALRAQEERLSDVLMMWLSGVLGEFSLTPDDLLSATTDGGSDIRRLGNVLLPCEWQWCVPHLLNCALADAFGTSLDPAKSKNPAARAVMLRAKKVVEYVNKSSIAQQSLKEIQLRDAGKALKLISDVPQRWRSLVDMLERLLSLWNQVRMMYSANGKPFTLDTDHALLVQLYSLMEPVCTLLTDAQSGSYPAAPSVMAHFRHLIRTVLNVGEPLELIDPADRDASVTITVDQIHPMVTETRRLLRAAITERFVERYSFAAFTMFDLCCFLYPPFNDLPYLSTLLGDTDGATRRHHVEAEIARLAVEHCTAQDSAIATATATAATAQNAVDAAHQASGASGAAGRGVSTTKPQVSRLHSLLQSTCSKPTPTSAQMVPLTSTAIVQKELANYKSESISTVQLSPANVLSFWRQHAHSYPNLAAVAKRVLGFAVSAAGIERDFSVAGDAVSRRRANLNDSIIEMMLYLNINRGEIPSFKDIPPLADHVKLGTVVPDRLKNQQYRDVMELHAGPNVDDESDDELDMGLGDISLEE